MSKNSKNDIIIKIVILNGNGGTLEVQKQAWNVQDVTIGALRKKVEDSSRVGSGEVNNYGGSGLKVELAWLDKAGDQVRLKDNAELALALKETKGAGLTVTANAFLVYWSDIDNVIEMSA